jgi:glycosyltransferase involved in cell wall biosynthesis
MKIALCSTIVPFVDGGARQIVEWLEEHLRASGHDVERVYLPEVDRPELLYTQMAAFRWIDLDAADRVICFRPQSHMVRHPHKVLWFIHHVRILYDLWDSELRDFADDDKHRGIRDAIRAADSAAIGEARAVFTNSQVVSDRLRHFNGVHSTVLYPPVYRPERFTCQGFNDEIVYVSRLEWHKRQHLLIEALRLTTTPVRLRLCGTTSADDYPNDLIGRVNDYDLADRVSFENRWISEDEKAMFLSRCLAAAYMPVDEDSYGYPTLEAAHSSKPVLTTSDSGGVMEFVVDGVNGFVCEPTAVSIADAMDRLYADRAATQTMGKQAAARIDELGVGWPHVIESLLA